MIEPFNPIFFRRLQQLKIRTRRAYLGSRQGSHRSLRRGHGLEFYDYRVYSPGDDFRHIDWNVYGKTDRLYVREFREEQDLNVFFLLDSSNSMNFPEGQRKFDLARELTVSLGYVALSDGDSVSVALLGQRMTPKFHGAKSLPRMMKEIFDTSPAGQVNILNEVRASLAYQKTPGKCFFISDFLTPLQSLFPALDLIRSKNFDLSLVQILAPDELTLNAAASQAILVDSESNESVEVMLDRTSPYDYAKALADHIGEIERYCQKASISHLLVSSQEKVADIVLQKLPQLGLLK